MDKENLLAQTLVEYSLDVQKNETVMIQIENEKCFPLAQKIIDSVYKREGIPYVKIVNKELDAHLLKNASKGQIELLSKIKKFEVEQFDCFLSIHYSINDYVDKNIPPEIRSKLGEATKKSDDIRINKRKWVLLNYPSVLDSFKAHKTTEEFTKYAFDVMTYDYKQMEEDMKPLKELMEQTDQVRIVAPNTDLTFRIKGIPAIPCCGKNNIPDGEIFTAPIKNSVNGVITYNTPSPYQGNIFHHVSLTFEDGKIIHATCDEKDEELNQIFDIDSGARYVGEFAIGLNPLIRHPMGDILFDEKIIGSIHFTPGQCYEEANNGNNSSIHWDMVLIEREDYGGGELYFDDVLIRKNGKFVLDSLKHLNVD